MYHKLAPQIDRMKLLFASIFLFFLAFPYSVWGYMCFFPDIFTVLSAYWISSDESKGLRMILVVGLIAVLRTFFGGEFLFSVFIIFFSILVSFLPGYFKSEFSSVLKISFSLSLIWVMITSPLFSILDDSRVLVDVLICSGQKVFFTVISSASLFPFVKSEKKDKLVFWLE